MRLFSLILLLAVPTAASAAPPVKLPTGGEQCPSDRATFAEDRNKAPTRRLGELPPGAHYLAVDRQVAGCRKPVIVGYGFGAGGRSQPGR